MRWVLDQPGVTAPLWGARHPGQLIASDGGGRSGLSGRTQGDWLEQITQAVFVGQNFN